MGADVLGPEIFRKVPEVDLEVFRSDAKSASEYNCKKTLSGASPTYETRTRCLLW